MTPIRVLRAAALASVCACLIPASASAQANKPAPAEEKVVAVAGPQGFSVVLVLGDMQSASSSDNVPPAARKALADMKDFLPYKSYRLLDAQWILGSERASTRLRGPEDQEYELTLRSGVYVGKLRVTFQLQEPGIEYTGAETESAQRRPQVTALQDRLRQLEQEAAALRARSDNQREVNEARRAVNAQMNEVRRQIAEMERAATIRRGRSVIDTTFNMDVGETVVVGTSRTRGGDKALIALLTAVPKGGTPKRDD